MDNRSELVKLSQHEVPLLRVPDESEEDDRMWSTYSILDNKFSTSKLILPPYDRPFGGSSEGWLVTLDESLAVTTFTPDPVTIPNDLIVAVIFDEFCELAYIKPAKDTM
ncbi:hypothetical protein TIFTF001_013835 [Ficus carica]|uniref:Uncharacterized protein n=1 Tax=Ficus carica TaxID=3494 RepID=A0AA88AIK4_FICCA|nr:hypothetical protein TIFTF001_013835 [Ficus carica]